MHHESANDPIHLVELAVGRSVVAADRVLYEVRGSIVDFNGGLELRFEDGSTLFFDSGPDGESLAVVPEPWTDAFAEPLSAENRIFVEQSGKWRKINQPKSGSPAPIVGATLIECAPQYLADGRPNILSLRFDNGCIVEMHSIADEMVVTVSQHN